MRWHCPPDTWFETRALMVWGWARDLLVTEAFFEVWRPEWGSTPRSPLSRKYTTITRTIRNRLIEPRTRMPCYIHRYRAFYKAGPTLWNKLPKHIIINPTLGSFKQNLKTHLFKHTMISTEPYFILEHLTYFLFYQTHWYEQTHGLGLRYIGAR